MARHDPPPPDAPLTSALDTPATGDRIPDTGDRIPATAAGEEAHVLSEDEKILATTVAKETLRRVRGSDATARSQAEYIVRQKMLSRKTKAVPPWLIDMLIEFALEQLRKRMEERVKESNPDRLPPVES